ETEAAGGPRLREVVAERGAERPREDVRDPECRDGIECEAIVRDGHGGDQAGEDERRQPVPEVEALGGEIAGGCAEGEREENGEPVERLASRGEDGVDRERSLAREPRREGERDRDGERD